MRAVSTALAVGWWLVGRSLILPEVEAAQIVTGHELQHVTLRVLLNQELKHQLVQQRR